jgi:hypothetical protein
MKEAINYAILGSLIFYLLFLNHCNQEHRAPPDPQARDTTITIDTTSPPPIVIHLPRQVIPEPMVIYIDSSAQRVEQGTPEVVKAANLYQDSIKDENLTLYYNSTIDGQLLAQTMSYQLHVPRTITKRIEIPKPYPIPAAQLLLKSSLGLDRTGVKTWSVGLQFISKQGLSIGYNYGLLQQRHEVSLGYPLWRARQ